MSKKLCSYRVLSCALAVLLTLVFIIACGSGQPEDDFPRNDIDTAIDKVQKNISSMLFAPEFSSSSFSSGNIEGEESSSSEETQGSSSSSAEKQPSSASLPSSSSSEVPSSSSESLYVFSCTVRDYEGAALKEIPIEKRPEVKCTLRADASNYKLLDPVEDIYWYNEPTWDRPAGGVYNNIEAKVDSEDKKECQGARIKCNGGIITIIAPSSSSRPSSSSAPPPQSSSSVYVPPPQSSSSTTSGGGVCGEGQGNMCLWNAAGDCWPVNSAEEKKNCGKNGWLFQGGEQGEGTACKNGTFICGKDNSPPAGGATSLGCCKWASETRCYNIYTQKEKDDCSGSSTDKYWSQACPDKNGGCPP